MSTIVRPCILESLQGIRLVTWLYLHVTYQLKISSMKLWLTNQSQNQSQNDRPAGAVTWQTWYRARILAAFQEEFLWEFLLNSAFIWKIITGDVVKHQINSPSNSHLLGVFQLLWLGSQYVPQLRILQHENLGSFFLADTPGWIGVILNSISYCISTS